MLGSGGTEGRAMAGGAGREPRHTIHSPEWAEARERVARLAGEERAFYAALLDHVEARWAVLRPLQLAYERRRTRARAPDAYGQLLSFVDGDLVDVYRGLALEAARLVPGAPGAAREGDPADLDGEATAFARYALLLSLAVAPADVPPAFRAAVQRAAEGVAEWRAQVAAMVRRIHAAARRDPWRPGRTE